MLQMFIFQSVWLHDAEAMAQFTDAACSVQASTAQQQGKEKHPYLCLLHELWCYGA